MDISYGCKKLKKKCDTDKELTKAYGVNCARKIRSRLDDLHAASNLEVLRSLPGRCRELVGDKKGQLSLDLEQPLRLIFEPANTDVQYKDDGGLNWASVNAVKIISVEDTHG